MKASNEQVVSTRNVTWDQSYETTLKTQKPTPDDSMGGPNDNVGGNDVDQELQAPNDDGTNNNLIPDDTSVDTEPDFQFGRQDHNVEELGEPEEIEEQEPVLFDPEVPDEDDDLEETKEQEQAPRPSTRLERELKKLESWNPVNIIEENHQLNNVTMDNTPKSTAQALQGKDGAKWWDGLVGEYNNFAYEQESMDL